MLAKWILGRGKQPNAVARSSPTVIALDKTDPTVFTDYG